MSKYMLHTGVWKLVCYYFYYKGKFVCKLPSVYTFCRWGEASLDERPDKVYLAFTILLKVSNWRRRHDSLSNIRLGNVMGICLGGGVS